MQNRRFAILVISGVLLCTACTHGGISYITGKEWSNWSQDKRSLVVGRIRDVRLLKKDGNRYAARFFPLATLAGGLDPSLYPELRVEFYVSDNTSSINQAPREDSTVMAVMQLYRAEDKQTELGFIVSAYCAFMPDLRAMVEVNGFDDPRLTTTLAKVQQARANRDPSPYSSATTRPTTRPTSGSEDRK